MQYQKQRIKLGIPVQPKISPLRLSRTSGPLLVHLIIYMSKKTAHNKLSLTFDTKTVKNKWQRLIFCGI